MKRLGTVLLVVVSVVVAALIRAAEPASTNEQVVPTVIGQLTALNSSTNVRVASIAVTTTLTGPAFLDDVAADEADCFLVAEVEAVFRNRRFGAIRATVVSGGKTFAPDARTDVLTAEPGFTTYSTVPIVVPKDGLAGARLRIETNLVGVSGYHRIIEVDLGLTDERVAELLASAATPVTVSSGRTEATP